ncbi:hypothetical protein BDY19DRAFT_993028 [Irpex rosettiformis]|uniref:Uncharacterized protein n=1 Tax=Irpex rosettiformis TaxID=378272 RepID=A0ACB8U5A8_9APHY|nr:hypothetical protein BDY19DRAFT_993028 [Irpex rosettiformis]
MTATCLSVAPNLRCQTLTQLESSLVIIPPVLEIIFCIGLCIVKRGQDRKHLLLAGDGFLYFVLALFDVLAHVVVEDSYTAFKAFDITIGAVSAIPLFMFTLYLTVLTTQDFQAVIPYRIRWITKYTLFISIPLIVISNAIGSFFSLRYVQFTPTRNGSARLISVGFINTDVVTFMNSLTLVLLILMHGVAFLSSIARLVKVVLEKRRIEVAKNQDNEAALINGLGWMVVGIKLGFVEAVLGFVGGSFATIIVRRGLRFLSRAFLIIGVVKGMDVVEDFSMFTIRGPTRLDARRSRAAALSGIFAPNPRRSLRPTSYKFDQESKTEPPASAYSNESFSIQHVLTPSPIVFATSLPSAMPVAFPVANTVKRQPSARSEVSLFGERVVVTYRHGRAPTLDLRRFSKLMVPLPEAEDTAGVPPRPATAFGVLTKPTPNPYSPTESPTLLKPVRALSLPPSKRERSPFQDLTRLSVRPAPSPSSRSFEPTQDNKLRAPSFTTGTDSRYSTRTVASHVSDSLEVVHALTAQFPGVPARKLQAMQQRLMSPATTESDIMGDISRSNSGRSIAGGSGGLVRRSSSVKRKPVPNLDELTEATEGEVEEASITRRARPRTYTAGELNSTSPASPSPMRRGKPRPVTHTPSASQPGASTNPRRRSTSRSRSTGRSRSVSSSQGRQIDPAFEFPGKLGLADVMAQDQAELDAAWKQLGEKKQRRPRASSIKSIGSVTTRRTPTPSISTSSQRSSVVPEWHGLPGESGSMSFPQAGIPHPAYRRDLKVSRFSEDSSAYAISAVGRQI